MIFLFLAAAHGTIDLSDRTEIHARVTQATGAGESSQSLQGGFDFYNAALAKLQISTVRWDYDLSYSPTISITQDIQQEAQSLFYQYANASAAWHNRFLRMTVTESASYGEYNSALLLQAPVLTTTTPATSPPLQPAASTGTIKAGSSVTDGVLTDRLDVFSDLTLGGGYSVSGGVNASSRVTLPELYGPHARAVYSRAISRRDGLSTVISGEISSSTEIPEPVCAQELNAPPVGGKCAPRVQIGQASESLAHRFTPTVTFTASAGVSLSRSRISTLVPWEKWTPNPVAGAALEDHITRRWLVTANATYAPGVDPRTGLVYELLEGGATFTDHESHIVTLTGGLTVARTLSKDDPAFNTYVLSADVEAAFLVNRVIDIGVGERAGWQSAEALGGFFSAYTFVALTLHAPIVRF